MFENKIIIRLKRGHLAGTTAHDDDDVEMKVNERGKFNNKLRNFKHPLLISFTKKRRR